MRHPFFFGLAVGAAFCALLWAAQFSHASCGFGCLHRQIEAIRRQTLPTRVLRLEERLAQDETQIKVQGAQIARLEAQASQVERPLSKLQAVLNCFGEVPITRYGNELGPSGYLFHLEGSSPLTIATTALDITYPKDPVGAWIYANSCRSPTPESLRVHPIPVPAALGDVSKTPGSRFR